MPAENLNFTAYWLCVEEHSEDIDTVVDGLIQSIDQTIIEGKDVEVSIQITVKSSSEMDETERDAISSMLTSDLEIKNQGILYIDISIMVKEAGQDDIYVSQLTQMISITLNIPLAQQGYKNYQIMRVHDGVTEVMDSVYDEEAQTISFETDQLSTYAIVYDASSGSGLWWLLLLVLLIPAGYFGYRYQNEIKGKMNQVVTSIKKRIQKNS